MNDHAIIELLKRALSFYADEKIYDTNGMAHVDRGGMARGVLQTIDVAAEEMGQVKLDYLKLQEQIQNSGDGSPEDIEHMKEIQEILKKLYKE